MTKAPYIAMYPTVFMADTAHLGNTELGIYWRLLLVYYRDQRPLPVDSDRLRRLAMTFSPEECKLLDSVMTEFFTLTAELDGTRTWHHGRADREIERAQRIYGNKVAGAAKARAAAADPRPAPLDPAGNLISDLISDLTPARYQPENRLEETKNKNTSSGIGETKNTVAGAASEKSAPDTRAAPRRGTRLPLDWAPHPDLRAWATAKRPDLELGTTIESFVDYWASKPGADGTKLDWDATFRNWVRQERAAPRARTPSDLAARASRLIFGDPLPGDAPPPTQPALPLGGPED
jgi:uncharacterized protein YdaU (DUF1376 family)